VGDDLTAARVPGGQVVSEELAQVLLAVVIPFLDSS
jgi:hypothetical protein